MRRAVVDLGTNSAILLVGERTFEGDLRVLEERLETPRLGEGLGHHREVGDSAYLRARATLERFLECAQALGVREIQVLGTAVFRRAANGVAIAERLEQDTGTCVRILSGEDEALLGYEGVVGNGPEAGVIDVGGGSCELLLPEQGTSSSSPGLAGHSIPIGALSLAEEFGGLDGGTLQGWEAAREAVREALTALVLPESRPALIHLIGGAAVSAASVASQRAEFSLEGLEGMRLEREPLLDWSKQTWILPAEAREAWPIEPGRAPLLPAGLLCLAETMGALGAEAGWVSCRGLRHGALARALAAD